MEMEYKDPSRRGRWVILVGVVLALAAGGFSFFLINQAQQQAGQAGSQTVPAVVAARPIPPRKPIEAADVTLTQVPIAATPAEGVLTDPNVLVGRVLAVPVFAGQIVTTNLLASTTAGGQFSILEPDETIGPDSPAWRAVSLQVPDDRAVAGLIQPNMTVDVFATATVNVPQQVLDDGRYYTDKSTKITYQDVLILARTGAFYIIRADLPLAEEIIHLQATGNVQFSMALRPEQDTRIMDASGLGATTNRIITRYGLPIPENYPAGNAPIVTPPPLPAITPAPSNAPEPAASPSPAP